MIVRDSLACLTCGQKHTVRMGMGHDERQLHTFPCRSCGENITVGLRVDYTNITAETIFEENCERAVEDRQAPVVNLDANFLVPEGQQGVDHAMFRLPQVMALVKAAQKEGLLQGISADDMLARRHVRTPSFKDEWNHLRTAWSLKRSGRRELSERKVREEAGRFYPAEAPTELQDWLFRFLGRVGGIALKRKLTILVDSVKPIAGTPGLQAFFAYYATNMLPNRGAIYFNAISGYMKAYRELAQCHLLVTSCLDIPSNHHASSTDFELTRMLYGNLFEALGSLVDLPAFLNNMLQCRAYQTFERLTLEQFYLLDKVGRFNPFKSNAGLAVLGEEADNQLRNASHHGQIEMLPDRSSVRYRAGKGGTGPVQEMSYSHYLEKCCRIMTAILTLYCVELILCDRALGEYPL